ncbi:MAG: DMT family transporter [Pseudomonadota bacterium]
MRILTGVYRLRAGGLALLPTADNTRGLLLAFVAAALFATTAAMAKVAVTEFHVLQILFFRQLVVFCSSLPAIYQNFPSALRTEFPLQHVLRVTGAFTALVCSIWAVAVLPLTTAVTLGFAQVFFVALFAAFFLQEKVGMHRRIAVIAGFAGVLVAMRPGTQGLLNLYSLIPVVGALGAAVAITSVRKLSQTESTATLLVYQATFVGVLAGIPLFWLWVTPGFYDLLFLLGIGVIAAMGQWIGVNALRIGEASVIGNVEYTKLVFAAVVGYAIFGEVPDGYTLAGAVIIVIAAVYLYHREQLGKNVL